jgi:hypothetical protein
MAFIAVDAMSAATFTAVVTPVATTQRRPEIRGEIPMAARSPLAARTSPLVKLFMTTAVVPVRSTATGTGRDANPRAVLVAISTVVAPAPMRAFLRAGLHQAGGVPVLADRRGRR